MEVKCTVCKSPNPELVICFSCYTNVIDFIISSKWNTKKEFVDIMNDAKLIRVNDKKQKRKEP